MLSPREKEDFARAVALSTFELDAVGIEPLSVVASVVCEIDELLSLNNPDVMARRARHFSIAGTSESDYSEKFYRLENGQLVLAGIRHLSADPQHPFVHFVLSFVPSPQDLQSLARLARSKYSKFKPKHLSFSSRPSLDTSTIDQELVVARNYFAGRVASLRGVFATEQSERILFEPFEFEKGMAWYRQAYMDFHLANPSLRSWVPITDEEDLRSCDADGWIFQVRVDGQIAGLVAAQRKTCVGVSGAYMTELLLVPPFKGQGLALAMQRKFIDELPSDIELVWGTIDAKNQASMKTALKVGRVAIRSEFFLTL